jgi:uncharacterized repeat protein (TIGR03803 family)
MFTRLTPSRLLPFFGLAAAIAAGVLASARVANAQANLVVLHGFVGEPDDGAAPYGGLTEGLDGTLYGTTFFGGANNRGTIFRMDSDGSNFAILHSFASFPGDGATPYGSLLQASDGMLYGTTGLGGVNEYGTVFQIAPDGRGFAILHTFSFADGASPHAGLIQAPDGTLYGTTDFGGIFNYGAIFRIAPGSGFAVVHSFNRTDGWRPDCNLIQGPDGTLYGTTYAGGENGSGTVFQMAPDGSGFTLLHSFAVDGSDGANPGAGLLQAADGTLYGTTSFGGANQVGTTFQIAPDGSFAVLHSFSGTTDGATPSASLTQVPDGTLYGTTNGGGSNALGTIFQIAPDGSGFAVVHSFSTQEGDHPYAGLIQGPDGTLYGTTTMDSERGTVFQLTLSPPRR